MDKFKITDEIEVKTLKRRNKMKEGFKLRGDVVLELRKDGKVIEREELKNLIVNTGKERVAKLLSQGVGGTAFGYLAIGTGTTSPTTSDTGLETEVSRGIADNSGGSYEANYKAVFEKTFTFSSGESYNITEAALSDSASASGETILDRFTFAAKSVDADTDLFVKVTITVS